MLLRIIFLTSLFSFASAAQSFSLNECKLTSKQQDVYFNEHLFGGQPDLSKIYARRGYVISYDRDNLVPKWAAWHASPSYRDTPTRKSRWKKFWADEELNSPSDDDYKGWHASKYNFARGHLVPYFISGGDRDADGEDAEYEDNLNIEDIDDACTVFEVNYLSNIAPQYHNKFNGSGGLWYKLETEVRKMIENQKEFYLFAGTIFIDHLNIQKIGDRSKNESSWKIGVPHGFFKIIIDPVTNQSVSFIFDHGADLTKGCALDEELHNCIVSVKDVEDITGLVFFNQISNENTINTVKRNRSLWEEWLKNFSP